MANISCSAKNTKNFAPRVNTARKHTQLRSTVALSDDAATLKNKTKNKMQKAKKKNKNENTNQQNKRVERVTRLIKTWNATNQTTKMN